MSWTIKYQKTNEFKKQTHNYTQCPMTCRQGKQRWTCGFVATGATSEERIRQLKAHHSCENCPIVYGRYTPFGYYTNWVNDHYDAANPLQPPINPELVNEGLLKGEKKGILSSLPAIQVPNETTSAVAREIWEARGKKDGQDAENWSAAEKILRQLWFVRRNLELEETLHVVTKNQVVVALALRELDSKYQYNVRQQKARQLTFYQGQANRLRRELGM